MSSDNHLVGINDNYVSFTINSKPYTVTTNVPLETSLNTYIRDYAQLKGTKYMCKEGGCGACVVAITTTNPFTNQRNTYAVNSCLFKVWSCHNADIVTIENANTYRYKNSKNTISESLAIGNGTQCGYCSPGMVMNMYGLIKSNPDLNEEDVEFGFSGNICRCTGYRPILQSFRDYVTSSQFGENQVPDIEDNSCAKLCPMKRNTDLNCHHDEEDDCECLESCFIEHALAPKTIKMKFNCGSKWYKVASVEEIFEIFTEIGDCPYMLINGDTAQGVNPALFRDQEVAYYIDVTGVKELKMVQITPKNIILGGNVTLTDFLAVLKKVQDMHPSQYCYAQEFHDHVSLVANVPVRNAGTLAGNLTIKHKMLNDPTSTLKMFQSDIFLLLDTIGATLSVAEQSGMVRQWSLTQYLGEDMKKKVIKSITLPALPTSSYQIRTYKIMPRAQNAPAAVNAGFLFKIKNKTKVKFASIVYGGINEKSSHAKKTENYLINKDISSEAVLQEALNQLNLDLNNVIFVPPEFSPTYRKQLAINLFYKTVLSLNRENINPIYRSGADKISKQRSLSKGQMNYPSHQIDGAKGKMIPKLEAMIQCKGEAQYINDIPVISGQLYGALVIACKGPGTLIKIDAKDALMMQGVVRLLTAKDIPPKGSINIFDSNFITPEAEELFAQTDVKYAGQPVGILIANTQDLAIKAARKVHVHVKSGDTPLLSIDDVLNKYKEVPNERIVLTPPTLPIKSMLRNCSNTTSSTPETSVNDGDPKTVTIQDEVETGAQYHYSMELQTCAVVPIEDGQFDIYSSTQWPASVQRSVSRVLGITENKINLSVRRLGGAYGCKLTRPAIVASACSLAAYCLKRPVRMVLDLTTNMKAIGKRCSVKCCYKVTVNSETGKILSIDQLDMFDNQGITLNDPVCYYILGALRSCYSLKPENFTKTNLYGVKTDIPSSSWCRAPGSLEGIAVIESIMNKIAVQIGKSPDYVRLQNMNDELFINFFKEKLNDNNVIEERKAVNQFNSTNRWKKQGFAIIPMEFPIEFFLEFYCTVTVNGGDGSVSISHGGTEMGQGINTKAAVAAAYVFGMEDVSMIQVKPTTVMFSPNNCPTGGSMGSDAITFATLRASKAIKERLDEMKNDLHLPDTISWKELIETALEKNINLSCTYMWTYTNQKSDPEFNTLTNYKVAGVCAAKVELDVLTGQQIVRHVRIWEDIGASFAPQIDMGQVQGAFIMGMGYFTSEHLVNNPKTGELLTNRTWNYDPPGALDIPEIFDVILENRPKLGANDSKEVDKLKGVIGAKATGEPPLCLSVAVLFAIKDAIKNARKDAGLSGDFTFNPPATIENNLLNSSTETSQFKLRSK